MSRKGLTVRDLTMIGVSTALLVLCTMFLKIQGPTGMIHFGSAALFTVAAVFGGVYAALAGALGSLIFDLLGGQLSYTIWSFFIKGIAGLVVGAIACGIFPDTRPDAGRRFSRVLLGCLAGMVVTAVGYFFAWWQVIGDVRVAFANIYMYSLPTSVIGTITACAIAVPLYRALDKSGFFGKNQ